MSVGADAFGSLRAPEPSGPSPGTTGEVAGASVGTRAARAPLRATQQRGCRGANPPNHGGPHGPPDLAAPLSGAARAPGAARRRGPAARGALPVAEAAARPAPRPLTAVPRWPAEPVALRAGPPPGMSGHGELHRAPGRGSAAEWSPLREWRPRWSASGGLHSGRTGAVGECRTSRHPVSWCGASGAPVRAPTMPCTPTHRTARSTGVRRSGRHSRPLHPMRVRRVTMRRMRCTRCTPLSRCAAADSTQLIEWKATLVQPRVSRDLSTFPLDTVRYHCGDGRHRAPDARWRRGDFSLPAHRASSLCVGAMLGAGDAARSGIAVCSTGWEWMPLGAPG